MARAFICLLALFLVAANATAKGWCFDEAAAAQNVSPIVLRAIAAQESSCGKHNFNPRSGDHGPMQINDSWLRDPRFRRLGVTMQDLYKPCTANYIAAWVLAACYREHGVTWQGVGCYNAKTYSKQIKYANIIYNRIRQYQTTGKGICIG